MLGERLVGRLEELASVDHALDVLDGGRGAALAVVGEPGIGKTRLLRELAVRADRRSFVVLSGSAAELERDLPFWVFVDAIEDFVRSLEPRRLASLDDDVRVELGHVFPALAGQETDGRAGLIHERYRAHGAVRDLLERLTAIKPLVLLLDDVHWADPASVDLLGALWRRPPDAAVLIAVAMRPRQAPPRLWAALERAHHAGGLERVDVAAFSAEESRQFLGADVDTDVAASLYNESGGNPFYLEQLARAAGPTRVTPRGEASAADVGVPAAVAMALAEETALLSDGARLVLQGAAVAGDPFEPDLAAGAAAVAEVEALEAVDELLRFDLVRRTDVPRRFRFRHPLVRRAVYESTPAGWRLGAHASCADVLAARGASPAEQAHHLQHSAKQGDSAAIATLRQAGEAAAQRAPATAATWFGEALRLLPHTAPADVRVELLLARARMLIATGQFDHGHDALLGSLALVPAESVALRVRLTSACAGVEHLLGHHDQAHARLARAIDDLGDHRSPEATALMIDLAMDRFATMDYPSMRQWAETARSASQPLGDRPLAGAATAVAAFAAAADNATAQAHARRAEAATLVDSLDDPELARRLDAVANLAGAELYLDRYPDSERHAERALAIARATGQSELIPLADSIRGHVKLLRGKLVEAGDVLDSAIEAARLSGNVQALAGNLTNRSLTALAAGNLDLALATAEENDVLTRGLDQSLICAAAVALAAVLVEAGQPRRAVDVLTASSGGDDLALIPGVFRPRSLELLTRCLLASGRRTDAEQAATSAHAAAAGLQLRMADAMARRAAAAVALATGDPTRAAEHAGAAAIAAHEIGAPIEAALARILAGRALSQLGQREHALTELRHAAATLYTCGARRYGAAADQALRSIGDHPHRRSRAVRHHHTGLEWLTERELQVAHLVVDRRTNAEIADALFLSPKTVETHIRNIFHKLDVSSRVELARQVERTADPAHTRPPGERPRTDSQLHRP
jgi:DNA-binding CsgD family transcriptional regulator